MSSLKFLMISDNLVRVIVGQGGGAAETPMSVSQTVWIAMKRNRRVWCIVLRLFWIVALVLALCFGTFGFLIFYGVKFDTVYLSEKVPSIWILWSVCFLCLLLSHASAKICYNL